MLRNSFAFILLFALFAGCSYDDVSSGDTGTGGSMARFTIKGDYLYAVDFEFLHTFNITDPVNVEMVQSKMVGFGIETIFPTDKYLFLGARNGMHIYSLEVPSNPFKVSFTPHFMSYDPVVVQENFAYVTLRSGVPGSGINVLQVYDIASPDQPELLMEYPMTDPKGLGIDGGRLFVCDKDLLVFHVKDGYVLELRETFPVSAIDVIPNNERLYVVAEDGFYQYNYTDTGLVFLSKIAL